MELIELGSIIEMTKGKKPVSTSNECKDGYLPYVDIEAFENHNIKQYTDGTKCVPCEEGDILIVCDGSRSGLVGRALKGYVGSTLAKLTAAGVNNDYLYRFIQGKYALLNTRKKGTGTPHLNPELLRSQKLIVPSEKEQERIVSRIDEMISELESGIETLESVKVQISLYRQAVLKCAFEGKYTEKYREDDDNSSEIDFESIQKPNQVYKDTAGDENEIKLNIPSSWKKIRIGDIFTVDIGATPKRSIADYWRGDVCWVSSGEVKFCSIYDTEEKITQRGVDNSSTNIQPIGTVLLAMIGEGKTRGQAAILGVPAAHNQNTAAILVSQTPCDPKFVYYFLMLNYENTRRVGSGNNQKALNKDRVRALHIPFASFKEQKLVVEEIEVRFSTCDNIEKTIDEALERAEALRQSILKKAFEGEL